MSENLEKKSESEESKIIEIEPAEGKNDFGISYRIELYESCLGNCEDPLYRYFARR